MKRPVAIVADPRSDQGVTLLELMVTLSIASVLMAIGILAMHSYLVAHRELGTASDVRSALRSAGERALSEGRTYCVSFTTTTWAVYRSDCTVSANKVEGPYQVEDQSITLTSITFAAPATPVPGQNTACPAAGHCAYFYPRGTALPGSLHITRSGKTYTVAVEGLTGRVSVA